MKKAYIPVSMIIFLAFLLLLLFLFPPMKEVELPFPQDSLEQSISSSGQELKAEDEIALRDWNDDPSHLEMFSPKTKGLYVVE